MNTLTDQYFYDIENRLIPCFDHKLTFETIKTYNKKNQKKFHDKLFKFINKKVNCNNYIYFEPTDIFLSWNELYEIRVGNNFTLGNLYNIIYYSDLLGNEFKTRLFNRTINNLLLILKLNGYEKFYNLLIKNSFIRLFIPIFRRNKIITSKLSFINSIVDLINCTNIQFYEIEFNLCWVFFSSSYDQKFIKSHNKKIKFKNSIIIFDEEWHQNIIYENIIFDNVKFYHFDNINDPKNVKFINCTFNNMESLTEIVLPVIHITDDYNDINKILL